MKYYCEIHTDQVWDGRKQDGFSDQEGYASTLCPVCQAVGNAIAGSESTASQRATPRWEIRTRALGFCRKCKQDVNAVVGSAKGERHLACPLCGENLALSTR
jgi:hypothetical protein